MAPRRKDGVLQAYWSSKADGENFGVRGDIVYDWGEGCRRVDGHLLHNVLSTPRLRSLPSDPQPLSFLEDLQARGYDLTTLRFSIALKPDTREAERLKREQYEREEAARREAYERAQYERLKAKYDRDDPKDDLGFTPPRDGR